MSSKNRFSTNGHGDSASTPSVTAQLDNLAEEYQGTRMALYKVLGKCLRLILEIEGDDDKERELEAYLNREKLTAIGNNKLYRQVVKAVVGPDDRKASKYASVLIAAAQADQKPEQVAGWIEDKGGVDAIAYSTDSEPGEGDEPDSGEGNEPETGAGDEPESGEGDKPESGQGDEPESGEGNEPEPDSSRDPELQPEPEMSDEQIINTARQLLLEFEACGRIEHPSGMKCKDDLVVLVGRPTGDYHIEILNFEPDQEVLSTICKKAYTSLSVLSEAPNDDFEDENPENGRVPEDSHETQDLEVAA